MDFKPIKLMLEQEHFPKVLIIISVVFLFVAGAGSIPKTQTVIPDDVGRVFLGIVGVVFLILGFLLPRSNQAPNLVAKKTSTTNEQDNYIVKIYPNTQDPQLEKRFDSLVSQASEVIMIGTGLAILEQNTISRLINLSNTGKLKNLEWYLGNPYNHQVELRLWEEECGNKMPLIPKKVLKQRIRTILREIELNSHHKENISLRLFSNYPTFAMFKIDDSYFLYNYSYAELGTFSPVLEFDNRCRTLTNFFTEHYHRLKQATVKAETVIRINENQPIPGDLQDLAAFAVYFIPPPESPEYGLGSEILGYDVRNKDTVSSPWENYVGGAGEFGLHLTIADALYFYSKSDVRLLEVQIRDVCADLHPFSLKYEVKAGFPDEHSISLVCSDTSGTLHALHSELVFRCYTQAAGSNYTLNNAPAKRNYCDQPDRVQLMNKLYKAPYILECFKPHITLLTEVPTDQMQDIATELTERFNHANPAQLIHFDKIAMMEKQADAWILKGQEIPLG